MLIKPTDEDWTLEKFLTENSLEVAPYGARVDLVFVDVETTGLNEEDTDHILELGMISTTDDGKVVDAFHCFLNNVTTHEACSSMLPIVEEMHTTSRLTKDYNNWLSSTRNPLGASRKNIVAAGMWMQEQLHNRPEGYTKILLAGNSITFDRMMLAKDAPELLELFHYRSIDVSTLKELAKIFNDHVAETVRRVIKLEGGVQHRSLPDCAASIREYRHYLQEWLYPDWGKDG